MSPRSPRALGRRRPCDPNLPRECNGSYLVDWDGDSTGEKVGLILTWLFLAAVFATLIYVAGIFLWLWLRGKTTSRDREARTAAAIASPESYAGRHWTVRDAQGQVYRGSVPGAPPDYDTLVQTMPVEKHMAKETTTNPLKETGLAL